VDFFKGELEKRLGFSFAPARPVLFTHRGDPYGWFSDHTGQWYNTVFVDCGRVKDDDGYNIKSALMEIAQKQLCAFRCTANQNVMLTYVEEKNKAEIDEILARHGITQGHYTKTKEEAIACVALPTCPLALAEAQRYLPAFVAKVEDLQRKHGLIEEAITT
ncbi:MAG: sulfite reductase subunit beta, partial [Alphaproteobacteria bacterium]|nr:sulfite reductase subunit beta [Alphaproteobacteria bacterium]